MKLLFAEIWIYLLLAFLLGMFVQWFFCCRGKKSEIDTDEINNSVLTTSAVAQETESDQSSQPEPIKTDWQPAAMVSPPDRVDELKRIKGIGAVIEKTLNDLGIYTFEQIAAWDENNIAWVENHLAFPGRIGREDWVSQAKTLSGGGETDFSKRVDKGDVDYS